jgi:autotransporter-associated beta strand protein
VFGANTKRPLSPRKAGKKQSQDMKQSPQFNQVHANCILFNSVIPSLLGICLLTWPAASARATSRTWTGASNGYWSEPSNWSPFGTPQNGDDLVFNNSPGASLTNDISGLSVGMVRFNHSCGIYGNGLTVTTTINAISADSGPLALNFGILTLGGNVSIAANDTTGWGCTLNCQVNLNGHNLVVSAGNSSGGVTLHSSIFGSGNLFFTTGNNYISNFGLNPNSFGGLVTVSGGTLSLFGAQQPAIPGNLLIEYGTTVSAGVDNAITNAATVQIFGGGNFLLNGRLATIYNLVMTNVASDAIACTVDSGSGGILGINGSITAYSDSFSVWPTIAGRLACNGSTSIRTFGGGFPGLDVTSTVLGDGFTKFGNAVMFLSGSNAFTGSVFVEDGRLDLLNSGALAASLGVVLQYSGSLYLATSISNKTLDAHGDFGSVLYGFSAAWTGPIILETNLTVYGTDFTLSGLISGSGGLEIEPGAGPVIISGTASNTFTGSVSVYGGLVEFGKQSASARAFNGTLFVGGFGGTPGEARWLASYQNPGATLVVLSNGLVNLNNHNEDFGSVLFEGGTVDSGPNGQFAAYQTVTVFPGYGTAIINGNLGLPVGADRVFDVGAGGGGCDLLVNALVFGVPSPNYFVKQGPGTMCMANANTFNAITLLEAGTLDIETGTSLGNVGAPCVITGGATLRLNGAGTLVQNFEMSGSGVGGTLGAIVVTSNSSWTIAGSFLLDA